jgi:hypothetical protein
MSQEEKTICLSDGSEHRVTVANDSYVPVVDGKETWKMDDSEDGTYDQEECALAKIEKRKVKRTRQLQTSYNHRMSDKRGMGHCRARKAEDTWAKQNGSLDGKTWPWLNDPVVCRGRPSPNEVGSKSVKQTYNEWSTMYQNDAKSDYKKKNITKNRKFDRVVKMKSDDESTEENTEQWIDVDDMIDLRFW